MPVPSAAPVPPLDPVGAALAEMATPLLLLDAGGTVTFANVRAASLFAGAASAGPVLAALLMSQGAVKPRALDDALRAGRPARERLAFADGRLVEAALAPLSSGGFALTFDDVTEHVRSAALARLEPLTGLCNRAELHERLGAALTEAERAGAPLAVLLLDLDRFKAVNDTLGHPAGDALLRKVAERLRNAARQEDVIARLGGDEFAILQIGRAGADALRAAEALAARLVELVGRTYVLDGQMLNVGASVGIALYPADGRGADDLMKHADLALYRAKADGRATYRFFEPAMNAAVQARRSLEIDLRRALALKQFSLAFQPQVSLETGTVSGFEALLRWHHPERGPISPATFIPLAEEIGVIVGIGEWALRTACREAASWAQPASIAVNLSPVQFRGGKLVETVTLALAQTGLDPARLELEITEGALLDDTDGVLTVLNGLRGLGVRISMDDFGTGYSSLSYLQKFPFDKIKIDQSFVRGMAGSAECGAIVRAIARLGASLGMRTTAEGVETADQLDAIRAEGCSEVQGYLTGRPMPADQAAALLT
ncbi:putative bifunctional diguanylate cyclase/phosphodiesterase [Methylorubrum salsuginis]|uniref:Diguanylate cyclase (GGDEF) domain-containing protein n=1 Tax=Methylorubrum salsuginis TaxID=414703 RepID=A0A1I4KV70_9HYPH|nr:EAL domain-containing protein [Methylorubrum salsuginis]SFL82704.1 diguanylate cyclase (GGDEF) domain-containing protein [Methylorubrum salsuginis]